MSMSMRMRTPDDDLSSRRKPTSDYDRKTIDAELLPTSLHPYSSVSVSPDYNYAIVASRDVVRVIELLQATFVSSSNFAGSSTSMREIRCQRVAQYFSHGINNSGAPPSQHYQPSLRDAFNRNASMSKSQHGHSGARADVVITDVAWGPKFMFRKDGNNAMSSIANEGNGVTSGIDNSMQYDIDSNNTTVDSTSKVSESIDKSHSLIAASASNGVVVIWQAQKLMNTNISDNSDQYNSGWKRSNDSGMGQPEAILSEHSRAVNRLAWHPTKFGMLLTASQDSTIKLWDRRAAGEKDSKQSRRIDGLNIRSLFGLPTQKSSHDKSLSANLDDPAWRCTVTITPKSDAIRDVKWSPMNENIFALVTDSGYLIIYNIRVPGRPWLKVACHSGEATSVDWHPSKTSVLATGSGRERVVKVWDLEEGFNDKRETQENLKTNHNSYKSDGSGDAYSDDNTITTTKKSLSSGSIHNKSQYHSIGSYNPSGFSTSKPYMKRAMSALVLTNRSTPGKNIHTLHVAAPITRIKWRPQIKEASTKSSFIPLTQASTEVVDAHDAMLIVSTGPSGAAGGNGSLELWSFHRPFLALSKVEGHISGAVVDFVCLPKPMSDEMGVIAMWQHTLSVGRDGRCLIQSLAKGHRPIESVPKSTFALGTLAPSETLRGSLQIVSVNQIVPSGDENDFYLTRLLDESVTVHAQSGKWQPLQGGQKEPESSPTLNSSIIDGYLTCSVGISDSMNTIIVAPELQYLSYFARSYRLNKSLQLQTISKLCWHNAEVASKLEGYAPLARMWMMLSAVVSKRPHNSSSGPLSNVLWPTVVSLLNERAEAGDVQTCVALCEVFEIIEPPQSGSGDVNVKASGLDVETIREWYLSYIDILHKMSLFSLATQLIRSVSDPVIAALNQQSTTIHECCSECNKPLQANLQIKHDVSSGKRNPFATSNLLCLNCRKRVGSCFLCHLPVRNGLFLFCPGCGHGGHVECASSWFNNDDSRLNEEFCPTGCGHKCSLKHHMSFPSDATFLCAEVTE